MAAEKRSGKELKAGEAVVVEAEEGKKLADKKLLLALSEIGFYKNTWSFDPLYIRRLLQTAALIFLVFTILSWYQRDSTILGTYRWMFLCYEAVFAGLCWFWFSSVEHGGGQFMFSPGWRDAYILTESTPTNYVVKIHIGYEDSVVGSVPYSSFVLEKDGSVDHYWLADELEEQLPKKVLLKR